jgi:F0F1-type ATP synthase alpha subunit
MDLNAPEIGKSVLEHGELTKEMEEKLKSMITEFKKSFKVD